MAEAWRVTSLLRAMTPVCVAGDQKDGSQGACIIMP